MHLCGVKIIEKFQLSSQYTPENFLDVYRQSILLELKAVQRTRVQYVLYSRDYVQ